MNRLIVLALVGLAGCSDTEDTFDRGRLLGSWKLVAYDQGDLWKETFNLSADGSYRFDADYGTNEGTWRVKDGSQLILEHPEGTRNNTFSLSSEQLILVDRDGASYTYEKMTE